MNTTTKTLEDGTTITMTPRPWAPGDPTEGNWLRISAPDATPELRAYIERFAAQLRTEDPKRTVIVDPA